MPPGAIGYQTFSVLLFWQPSPHPHDFKKATPPFSVAYEIQAAIRQEERKKKDKRQAAQSLFLFIKRTTALPEALPRRLLVTFIGQSWATWSNPLLAK